MTNTDINSKVEHPAHYERFRVTFEPADISVLLPHPIASAFEYIIRAPYKNGAEDYRKAAWWLRKALATDALWEELDPLDDGCHTRILKALKYTDAEYVQAMVKLMSEVIVDDDSGAAVSALFDIGGRTAPCIGDYAVESAAEYLEDLTKDEEDDA